MLNKNPLKDCIQKVVNEIILKYGSVQDKKGEQILSMVLKGRMVLQ